MFWIYIPPIILVIALAGLVIILGRKSGELKKINIVQSRPDSQDEKRDWKNRISALGRKSLDILEKILLGAKTAFKKTEQVFSVWASKLRARRGERKPEPSMTQEEQETETGIIEEIEKAEKISMDIGDPVMDISENIRYVGKEVIVRRKIEEPIVISKKEPIPEDKVREAALVYRIAENPRDIEAYREIGDYYLETGNIKDSKEAFKMVLKLRPRDLKAKSALREIEMKMRLGS